MSKTSRTFTASLKPAWSRSKMEQFCKKLRGSATVFIINHDKDCNDETGELKEVHTHILIDYETPRKITTVSNLLETEPNFIELVKSKKAMLKYLTHQDDPEKYQYKPEEVITNSTVSYDDLIQGQSLSDREIATYLMDGRGVELLGVVSATKLRTIQAFLQFDRTGAVQKQLELVNNKLDRVVSVFDEVENIAKHFLNGIEYSVSQLSDGMVMIAEEIKKARQLATIKQGHMKKRGN